MQRVNARVRFPEMHRCAVLRQPRRLGAAILDAPLNRQTSIVCEDISHGPVAIRFAYPDGKTGRKEHLSLPATIVDPACNANRAVLRWAPLPLDHDDPGQTLVRLP